MPIRSFSCAWSSCIPPVLPVLRLFGAGVAAVDVLAAASFLFLPRFGGEAQPHEEERGQQQHHRGDEVGVGDDAEGLEAALKAQPEQHPNAPAGYGQPVKTPDLIFIK